MDKSVQNIVYLFFFQFPPPPPPHLVYVCILYIIAVKKNIPVLFICPAHFNDVRWRTRWLRLIQVKYFLRVCVVLINLDPENCAGEKQRLVQRKRKTTFDLHASLKRPKPNYTPYSGEEWGSRVNNGGGEEWGSTIVVV